MQPHFRSKLMASFHLQCTLSFAASRRNLSAEKLGSLQMLDLPHGDEGLAWLASHGPAELPLIPGLQAASITAAAKGDSRPWLTSASKQKSMQASLFLQCLRRLRPSNSQPSVQSLQSVYAHCNVNQHASSFAVPVGPWISCASKQQAVARYQL